MAEPPYLKTSCKECGNHIAFPASATGTTIACPHCGQWTELTAAEEPVQRKSVNAGLLAIVCLLLIAGLGTWFYFSRLKKEPAPVAEVKDTNTVVKAVTPTTNLVIATQAVVEVVVAPKPKSSADLKVGKIQLEKTPGNGLVYAVGTVKNDSTYQRFGVRIELDLFNHSGDKIGSTQDYKDIIEPRQEWHFRALIPEAKKTVTAKMSELMEQE